MYEFEHIFNENSKQDEVYNEIAAMTQSLLDGYNVCIFSFGQTGSGKTYTMLGNGIEEQYLQDPNEDNAIPSNPDENYNNNKMIEEEIIDHTIPINSTTDLLEEYIDQNSETNHG